MHKRRFGPLAVEVPVIGIGAADISAIRRATHINELAGADRRELDEVALATLETSFPLAPWRGLASL